MTDAAGPPEPDQPLLRVVHGDPSAEEVAALVALLTSRLDADAAAPLAPAPSAWSAPSRRMRKPLRPGTDGWRSSALPG